MFVGRGDRDESEIWREQGTKREKRKTNFDRDR